MTHEYIPSEVASIPTGQADPRLGLRVLVVEDHPQLRHSICRGLQGCGHKAWAAKDGRVAVDLYHRLHQNIDIVLCDVQMPHLDGPQTLEALRAINPDVKFCFMTADSSSGTFDRLLQHGALYIFIKPFRVQEIARHLRSAAMASPMPRARNSPVRRTDSPDGVVELLWRAICGWFS